MALDFKRVLPSDPYLPDVGETEGIQASIPLRLPEMMNNPLDDPNAWGGRLYNFFGRDAKKRNALEAAIAAGKKKGAALAAADIASWKSSGSSASGRSGGSTQYSGSVNQALQQALKITGLPSDWLPYMQWLVGKESSGNPRAVNSTPVGSEHATGLLQTLPSTFRSYALSGYGDIFNPVDNAIASLRYIKSRYGSPANIPGMYGGTFKGY